MITERELFSRVRLLVKDTEKARYSDYEVRASVSAAVDMLCESLKKYFSRELVRTVKLELDEDSYCPLPDGFLYVVGVWDKNDDECEFIIEGGELYTEKGVALSYAKHPGYEEIDLPHGFLIHLADVAASLLRGDTNVAQEKSDAAARANNTDKSAPLPDPAMWG